MNLTRLLQDDPGASFSDLWYRVGATRPALSPHCQVSRQKFGQRTTFIVEDPAGGQYYRVNEPAYFFLGMLDGERTVDQAWRACIEQLGDAAPTQRECVEMLSRLQLFGLLHGEQPLAPDMISVRRRDAANLAVKRRTGYGITAYLPLHNPGRWLEATGYLWRAVFSWGGLAIWLLVVGAGLYHVLANLDGPRGVLGAFNSVIEPTRLWSLGLALLLLRAWHELGHATACKAMGARCTEMGLMLLLFVVPFPYCETSSAWRLSEVWKRVVVSAGGVMFETFVAGIAAMVWARADPGELRVVCFQVMLISGVTTLVFNLNPLLRYDGYYMLSDLLGIANLAQRAREAWRFVLERLAFGVKGARPPGARSTGEFFTLLIYGLASFPYRAIVAFSIVLVLWSNPRYMSLGAVLAAAAIVGFLVWPLGRAIAYIAGSPRLHSHRARAALLSLAAAGAVVAIVGVVPMSASVYAPGVVRPLEEEPVRPGEGGFIAAVHARAGEAVERGVALLTLDNPELAAAVAQAEARLRHALAERDGTANRPPVERELAERGVAQAEGALARARSRVEALVVRAPIAGVLYAAGGIGIDLANLRGRYVPKGALLAFVAKPDAMFVRAVVEDRDQAYAFPNGSRQAEHSNTRASVRVRGRAGEELHATILRYPPAGSRTLTMASLGTPAGGEIVLDPTDTRQQTTLAPQFVVDVQPDTGASGLQPGLRARVKLVVGREPLVRQWWRRAVQTFSERSQI